MSEQHDLVAMVTPRMQLPAGQVDQMNLAVDFAGYSIFKLRLKQISRRNYSGIEL